MHILLTRPLDDCKDLILKFKSLDNIVSHLPLIEIIKKPHRNIDFGQYKGVIFTSSNSLKNLDDQKIDKNIFCFCVGSFTEKEASKNGFQNIYCADGNVKNLKEIILQNFGKKSGKLIYICGELITSDLDKELISEGYLVDKIVNYSVSHVKNVKPDFFEKLKKSMPDVVFVYSQNSATSFMNIIKNNNMEDQWMNTNLMCIGEKTSAILNEIKWKKIFLFSPGEEEYLLYKI
jgi:uroporphyrinogen-III synthase|tara:strand:- start:703 stop:1401 length:699 start_codon:yes stop_codon:yes gene_type:complete